MPVLLKNRWLRAGAAALLVAAWPACTLDRASRDATAEPAKLDFTLKDVDGKDVRLADFKGKPLVINFWATWCGPCKIEVPYFVELSERYKSQGLTILGISTDDAPDDIRAFAKEFKINYPLLVGQGHDDVTEAYGAQMLIPVTWFIRADGTVSHSEAGIHPKEWFDAQIRALLE